MANMVDENDQAPQLDPEVSRFILDLEFLQCLANPNYIRHLALHENHYFQDENFIAYLKYLQYFKRPEYAKYVVYPHCFYFLDLLQDENFRKLATKPHFISLLLDQQNLHWKFYRSKRMRQEAEASNTPPNILPQQDDAMEQTNPVNVNM